MLEILEHEVKTTMGLCGVTRLDQLDRSYLQKVPANEPAHVLSAFPLLAEEY